jgi:hypothetical protein
MGWIDLDPQMDIYQFYWCLGNVCLLNGTTSLSAASNEYLLVVEWWCVNEIHRLFQLQVWMGKIVVYHIEWCCGFGCPWGESTWHLCSVPCILFIFLQCLIISQLQWPYNRCLQLHHSLHWMCIRFACSSVTLDELQADLFRFELWHYWSIFIV